jgi:hypothetical protein
MIPPELERDGRNLAAYYEALREHVLGLAVCRHTVHGLALLMRHSFCPGDRAETGRSRMPMARMRRMKAAPYAPSRSRIK